jgi:hypothetical protein
MTCLSCAAWTFLGRLDKGCPSVWALLLVPNALAVQIQWLAAREFPQSCEDSRMEPSHHKSVDAFDRGNLEMYNSEIICLAKSLDVCSTLVFLF